MPFKPTIPSRANSERKYTRKLSWTEDVVIQRMRLGITKDELASRCGLSRTTLWNIEMGYTEPTAEQRSAVERALKEATSSGKLAEELGAVSTTSLPV